MGNVDWKTRRYRCIYTRTNKANKQWPASPGRIASSGGHPAGVQGHPVTLALMNNKKVDEGGMEKDRQGGGGGEKMEKEREGGKIPLLHLFSLRP